MATASAEILWEEQSDGSAVTRAGGKAELAGRHAGTAVLVSPGTVLAGAAGADTANVSITRVPASLQMVRLVPAGLRFASGVVYLAPAGAVLSPPARLRLPLLELEETFDHEVVEVASGTVREREWRRRREGLRESHVALFVWGLGGRQEWTPSDESVSMVDSVVSEFGTVQIDVAEFGHLYVILAGDPEPFLSSDAFVAAVSVGFTLFLLLLCVVRRRKALLESEARDKEIYDIMTGAGRKEESITIKEPSVSWMSPNKQMSILRIQVIFRNILLPASKVQWLSPVPGPPFVLAITPFSEFVFRIRVTGTERDHYKTPAHHTIC